MRRIITYDIKLLEPVLVTSVDGDPNSSVSYNFIPGSVLRGVMIGRFQKAGNAIQLDNDLVRRLFFSAKTQFLNGYILSKGIETQRSWPLPKTWQCQRDNKTVHDLVFGSFPNHIKPDSLSDFGQLSGDSASEVLIESPIEKRISIHIQRDREMGRSTRTSGEIYNYEALAPGQTFRAHILTTVSDQEIEVLTDLIQGELHLGGSRSAGYGRVCLEHISDDLKLDKWIAQRCRKSTNEKMTITLLSDLLLRDKHGNWSTNPHELANALGVTLLDAYSTIRTIGGFNRKWGLPLPQRQAFQMGTVLVCAPPSVAQWTQLESYVRDGVGESREDGFGRIALNWCTQPSLTILKPDPTSPKPISLPEHSISWTMAQKMANRLWRNRLDAAMIAKANQLSCKQSNVSKSQLHRLRLKIQPAIRQTLQSPEDLDAIRQDIKSYLQDLNERRTPRQQFAKLEVDSVKILSWIEKLVDRTVAETKDVPPFSNVTAKVGNIKPEWTDALALEYNLRLIDKVLAGIAKKSKETKDEVAK